MYISLNMTLGISDYFKDVHIVFYNLVNKLCLNLKLLGVTYRLYDNTTQREKPKPYFAR